jgi:hypothetical protein
MKKILLSLGFGIVSQFASAQYFNIPFLNAGKNPGSVNVEGENPYPSASNVGWNLLLKADGTSPLEYSTEQTLPFAFKFNGSNVTKYTASNFGTVSFDAGTPTVMPSAFSNLTLPSANIPNNSVCVLGIKPQSVVSGTTTYQSAVMSKTYGKAPFRQHWVWFNFFGEANINAGWTYWAVVMEETTNNIYVVDMKTLCVLSGNLCTNNVKLSVGIQTDNSTAYTLPGSPNVGAQQISANVFTAEDNSYYQFVPGVQPKNDLAGQSVKMSKYLKLSDAPFVVSTEFMNIGSSAVNSADFAYSINGGAAVDGSASGSVNIASFAKSVLNHSTKWTPTAVGLYTIKVWPTKVNGSADENANNDTVVFTFNVIDKFVDRKILNEVFTSSTCGPCTAGNINYNNVINGKTKHSTIKYQVYWPGTGDPYCTQEVRDRTSYYGIGSVPRMEVDGGWDGNAGSFSTGLYDDFQAKPSFVEITGSVSLTWKNTITLDVTLNPLLDNSSNNLKLHAAIVEGVTYANKKSNGEKEFESVMKKMMTGSAGQVLTPLKKDTKVSKKIAYTFNGGYRLPLDGSAAQHINHLSENSVETWDDLAVVVFVQDATTKEVLQSETFPISMVGTEAVDQNLNLYPNPANNVFVVEAKEMGNAVVLVTDIQGKVVFNGNLTEGALSMNVADWSEGVYMVSVNGNSKNLNSKIVVRH